MPYNLPRSTAAESAVFFRALKGQRKPLETLWADLVEREARIWKTLVPLLEAGERHYRTIGTKKINAYLEARTWLEGWAALKALRLVVVPKARGFAHVSRRDLSVVAERAWREKLELLQRRLTSVSAAVFRRPTPLMRLLAAAGDQTTGLGGVAAMVHWIAAAEFGLPAKSLDRPSRADRLKVLHDAFTLRLLTDMAVSIVPPPRGLPVAYNQVAYSLRWAAKRVPMGYPLTLEIVALERRPYVPVALRGPPRADAVADLIVRTGARIRPLTGLLGKRTVLLVTPCKKLREPWRRGLARLAVDNARVGLTVGLAVSDACAEDRNVRGLWQSNAELPWALGIDAATPALVLLDKQGTVFWRQRVGELRADLAALQAELERSWPPYAAARRVSVEQARSVPAAKLRRLLQLAKAAQQAGRLVDARRHADRAVRFAPESSAAHRRLTLVAAKQRDLGTALAQLRWWEQRFGELASEVLRDDALAATRTTPDPGRQKKTP